MIRSNCFLSYSTSFVFIIGIILYIYNLAIDSQDLEERPFIETLWIYVMFCLLLLGFFLSSFCE